MFAKKDDLVSIRTERLMLVPLVPEHAKELLKLWGDPDVIRHMNLAAYRRQGECRARIKRLRKANVKAGCPNNFVLLLGREIIGVAGFPLAEEENLAFGFYYLLQKRYWGYGYASEAAGAILSYLFEHHPTAVVYADSVADNKASVAILQRLGFELTQREAGAFTKNGEAQDILHFKCEGK